MKILFLSFISAFTGIMQGIFHENSFKVINTLDHEYSWITFVENTSNNQQFLVKQVKNQNLEDQFDLVLDILGVTIAKSVGVLCNDIILISPYTTFPGKSYANYPATLHSIVPGRPIKELSGFEKFDLHQRWWRKNSLRGKKWPLSKERKGLCLDTIKTMVLNFQLCKLAAVDTFISNTDRHSAHLFYDHNTNSFWAIDFGDVYRCNLSQKAIQQFKTFIKIHNLSEQEINALKLYKKTLKKLVTLWHPDNIIQLLDFTIFQSGLMYYPHLSSTELFKKIARIKQQIVSNYYTACRLIELLEELL